LLTFSGVVQEASEQRKRALAGRDRRPREVETAAEMQAAMDQTARLEGELQRVRAENTRLLEQFVRWAYNASVIGLDGRGPKFSAAIGEYSS